MEGLWRQLSKTGKVSRAKVLTTPIGPSTWIVVQCVLIGTYLLGNLFAFIFTRDTPLTLPDISDTSISKIKLKLQDIQDAHNRIQEFVVMTPLLKPKHIGKSFCNVYLKCENLQNTGSFKARGTSNVLALMTPQEKSRGCTVAGGRNFLHAMTHYGFGQSVPINVVVPKDCPISDKQLYKENFAIIKVYGNDNTESNLHAITHAGEIGSNFVHGSDRLDLLAGYGTLGLELMNQLDKIDAIICPVGTGGLVASVIIAVKSLKPTCLIYGVESTAAPTITRALQEKKPVMIPVNSTIADSLSCVIAANNAFQIIRRYLDRIITVDEVWVSRAMLNIYEREKMVVEGAAACTVAVIMAGKVPELRAKNVVCVLSGGNVSCMKLSHVIERGMAAEGRLVQFSVALPDAPGVMVRLLTKVHDTGADVKTFVPERTWMRRDVFMLRVHMLIETSDMAHARELEKKLLKDYPRSHFSRT